MADLAWQQHTRHNFDLREILIFKQTRDLNSHVETDGNPGNKTNAHV